MQRIRTYLAFVRFEHTVFALPFALTSAWVCAGGVPPLRQLFWIVVAAVGARSAAMGFNRIADLEFDRLNPRTRNRELPTGKLTLRQAWAFVLAAAVVFIFAAYQLNRLAFWLSFPTLAWLFGYSYAKRFTDWSHVWLGSALGIAPVGAWIALKGAIELPPLLLMLAVTCWVAGFDIIYATLDETFDRQVGLHSLVVRLGAQKALWGARLLHAVFLTALAAFGKVVGLGAIFWTAWLFTVAFIAYEHTIAEPGNPQKVNTAFFTVNGVVSVLLFVSTALDLAVR
ncbi:4-hydroxybenzoate octaprenyltransferase [bacterium HR17]|jgi:4-hydroxybenzoate polyprenyltransferase|uniref:4-hydroxybenzoate polyprenyltransferase n=1 Tax=Candidatus Fervidibacter japonicus TaxID=2035412 RepID=A0A2H5XAE5_9BACT|nr:4-hydroxybenzoate octaprenyltransferase [bacterium HR17]